jgi:YebC/PmpR family DNA-binding regulatory protein
MVLEGYGPGGAAILVQALSDNRNRTVQNVRNVFTRGGGSLGESGCVAWLFDSRGVISIKTNGRDTDELGLLAIDAGADDVTVEKDYITVYTAPQKLEEVRINLERNDIPIESAEVTMVAKQTLDLDEKAAIQTLKMIDNLEELEEVRNVATNVNFSDAALNAYAEAK